MSIIQDIKGSYESGSEQWLSGQNYPQGTGGVATTADTIYYIPIHLEFDATITGLTIRAGATVSNVGTFAAGLYEFNDGVGGDLIVQAPLGDTAVGQQTLTFATPIELKAGYYFWSFWGSAGYNLGGRNGGLSILGTNSVNTQYKFKQKSLAYSTTLPATVETGTTYNSAGLTPRAAWIIA